MISLTSTIGDLNTANDHQLSDFFSKSVSLYSRTIASYLSLITDMLFR